MADRVRRTREAIRRSAELGRTAAEDDRDGGPLKAAEALPAPAGEIWPGIERKG